MAERKTNVEQVGSNAVYRQAVVIPAGGPVSEPAEAPSEALHQRTVATSQTQGTMTLRYAPRVPKAAEPVDTDS
jgi:hypothetical protein